MPKSIRPRTNTEPRWKPYPWARFSRDEFPRAKPLPVCPSQKCRRAKACLSAHKGLYCRRTHFASAEGKLRMPKSDIETHIASLSPPPLGAGLELRIEFIKEIAKLRAAESREKMKLWRAGAFDEAYGRYHTRGVMKPPPPQVYVEDVRGE
jgi:hypothetical protein